RGRFIRLDPVTGIPGWRASESPEFGVVGGRNDALDCCGYPRVVSVAADGATALVCAPANFDCRTRTPTVNASTPGYRFPIGSAHLSDCLRNIGCMHGFLPATAPYSRSPIARRLAAARDIGICGPGTCSERRRAGVGRAD